MWMTIPGQKTSLIQMLLSLLLPFALVAARVTAASEDGLQHKTYRLLFLGNSHTLNNDVPGMVKSLLESGGNKVAIQTFGGGLLDDLSKRQDVLNAIAKGKWTHIILQGANMSSSHKYEYSKQSGIDLANLAIKAGAKPLLCAEHPRRGWDEAAWIYGQYQQIQDKVGGAKACPIIPCPFAFQIALKKNPKFDLWAGDGNHASVAGSYLNALTIADWLAGPDVKMEFVPKGVEPMLADWLKVAARSAVMQHR